MYDIFQYHGSLKICINATKRCKSYWSCYHLHFPIYTCPIDITRGLSGVVARVLAFNLSSRRFESPPGHFMLESWWLFPDAHWFTVQNFDKLVSTGSSTHKVPVAI